ncbi:MAG: retroviral-like aspartic protease family protein [Planctomycetes bacterium]|nr:retroviral-like aspartic protease family protein [Planctomycetota bacterium]
MRSKNNRSMQLLSIICFVFFVQTLLTAADSEKVDWQGPAGSKIKGIRHFPDQTKPAESSPPSLTAAAFESTPAVISNVIDSPPVDGFVPWIVLTATNKRLDDFTWNAEVESSVIGSFPSGIDPAHDYFVGIFDTGASAHVIGYENAVQAGLFNSNYLTTNTIEVSGVTGSIEALVSKPYALFMDGLDALEPNAVGQSEMILSSTAGMIGESNISTIIANDPGILPDLNTAIGTPMSVYYDTLIENDNMITVTHNGNSYTGPRITFYDLDSQTPSFPNYVPLELRPLGAVDVQYIISLDLGGSDFLPATPSVIIGNSSQSLFFVHSVDLTEDGNIALDKDRFMLDTGAQVTVIGTRIAARLGLNPANMEFEVEIEGVTGDSIMAPGFYIDSITIPAIGQWLEFTNIPVILLDISSPEGGTLDGIIGMNLFTQYNLILRGGGMFLDDDPVLEFERIQSLVADIAPAVRDGKVNLIDLSAMSAVWLTANANADIAPLGHPDGIVDLNDLMVLADYWLEDINP